MESFNSDFVMVVNDQRITAFVSDCLCGIKAIKIDALKTDRFMYAERWRKFKSDQRKEISIRNVKLSEGTSRNCCIHSRIDIRAM